jgi:tRNA (guanine26-N2/guanine27-N2)-dimethyltransferase
LTTVDFTSHPDSVTAAGKVKVVRYQENPTPNWGPGKRATGKSNAAAAAALKRKRPADDETVEADKMT